MSPIEHFLFAQKRQEVHTLCDALFGEHVKATSAGKYFPTVDRFCLVMALGDLFHPYLTMVSGYCVFMYVQEGSYIKEKKTVSQLLMPHHWLRMHDNENHIIDVLPYDGIFGVSVPQAVLQKKNLPRFVPSGEIYPTCWNMAERESSRKRTEELIAILDIYAQKIPL
jgi:hypothetical protein